MHIPDGYLSPSTCAGLYAAAAPFWYAALQRVRKAVHTRMLPLVSVFAAFSFVVMMFNLPLPGGTTGHAAGMGVAAIVLGPWASVLAISVALIIQAVLFGDGGITAIGANCFNLAIIGSLAGYAIYRLVSHGAAIVSARRVVAAGIAGYTAINLSALCAAVELGLQPRFFHDASGAPLYAPYPLSVAIPAMMIGHLTIAGLAELVISSGIVSYLQRADPGLLRLTAPGAPDGLEPDPRASRPVPRGVWAGLAILLILTPLGILAAGSAWGEWTAQELADPRARAEIAAASRNQPLPAHVPRGLERLSAVWTAPLPRYSPAFIRSAAFGYLVSGMVGAGLVIFLTLLLGGRRSRTSFVEKTARGLLAAVERAWFAEETAQSNGLLQRLDARVKLAGMSALIVAAIAAQQIRVLCGLLAAGVLLAYLSHVPIRILAARVWIAVLAFTGTIALPAIFLTPGHPAWRVPILDWPVTREGLHSAALLILRAETAATLSVLLILCTLWTRLVHAMRFFRVPAVLVAILGMTYRYIFLFLQTARNMFEARQARLVGTLVAADRRRLAAATAGVLLGKSLQLSGDVHMAMQARGFRGEVHLLEDPRMRASDWLRLAAFVAVACVAVWLGR